MKSRSKEVSNIKGLSRTVYNGYRPVEDKSIDWSKLPTTDSNAVKPGYVQTPSVSAKYNPHTRIIELEQEVAFKNGQINELRAAVDREIVLNKELNEKLSMAYEIIGKLRGDVI